MSVVKIFKVDRIDSTPTWKPVMDELESRGYKICFEVEPADISIVLGGKVENPLALSGKRVLAYAPGEWQPQYYGWRFFAGILEHYYDGFIDLNSTSVKGAVDKIEEYITKCLKTANS